jgi:DNA-binding response OmpR family regulator
MHCGDVVVVEIVIVVVGDGVVGGVVGGGGAGVVTVGAGDVGAGFFTVVGEVTTVFLRVVVGPCRVAVGAVVASVTATVVGASVVVVGAAVVTVVVAATVVVVASVVVVRPLSAALACRGLIALSSLMTLLPTTRTPSMVIAVAAPVPRSHTSAITARRVPRMNLLLDLLRCRRSAQPAPVVDRMSGCQSAVTATRLHPSRLHGLICAAICSEVSKAQYRVAMPSIVLVEDDDSIRAALSRALTERGHVVSSASDGISGLDAVRTGRPDVVVLDLGLPELGGGEVLRRLRAESDVPVIIATAVDDEAEIIRVLDTGADDYIVKPFSTDHLEARVRAVLRRRAPHSAGPIEVGQLHIDTRTREANLNGTALELSRKEFDLLTYLAQRPGEVVTKRELLSEVWRQPAGGTDKTVDVHLSWLRRKLGESAEEPRFLHTIRGVGVKLVEP